MERETKCIQAGYTPKNGEPRMIPIIQSTTFKYDTSEDMGKLFDLEAEGFDAAIHFGRESWPDAVHLKLFDEALVVVAAPGRVAGLSLSGLAGQPLLQLETRPAAWRHARSPSISPGPTIPTA